MPRQSRTDKFLAEREELLKEQVEKARSAFVQVGAELQMVQALRKELATIPKRASRSKRAVLPNPHPLSQAAHDAANAQPPAA